MSSQRAPSRKPKYRSPDEELRQQDARRLEIMEQARVQSGGNGCGESVLLEALLVQEASERAKGDPERALFIFDWELELVQREQVCDAYENIMNVFKEIVAEVLAAGPDYKTVVDDAEWD